MWDRCRPLAAKHYGAGQTDGIEASTHLRRSLCPNSVAYLASATYWPFSETCWCSSERCWSRAGRRLVPFALVLLPVALVTVNIEAVSGPTSESWHRY